jgi:uroporphyrin-III C-methyltransferase
MNAVILLGHGARDPAWAGPLVKVREILAREQPSLAVETAFLVFMPPTLEEAVSMLAGRGAARIDVVPVFLAQGGHLKNGFPERLDALRRRYPDCALRLAAVAGEAPEVIAAIAAHAAVQADTPSEASRTGLPGKVWLVGAGPGDPELLTLKAARLISRADAIVYDHLVGEGILALARPGAEIVYAGKEASRHTLPQAQINAMLVALAKRHSMVVRLKGGDPFIFGRGGEELEALSAAGIPSGIVPGITAASGCAAYAGFPLTHRDHARMLTLATGHLKNGGVDLDWPALARPCQTVVFYMGVAAAGEISRRLMTHGLPADTPVAVVRQATLDTQNLLFSRLDEFPTRLREAGIAPPALIVVGEVVRLRGELHGPD